MLGQRVGRVRVEHAALDELQPAREARQAPDRAGLAPGDLAFDRLRIDAARALLVEDRADPRRVGAGAQIDRDVDLAAEAAVQRPGGDTLREGRVVDEATPERAGADRGPGGGQDVELGLVGGERARSEPRAVDPAERGKPIPQIVPMQLDAAAQGVEVEKEKRRENMKSVASDILKVMEPLVKGGQVKVTESNRGISIEINASLLFEVAKAELNKDSISVLTAVAKVLATDSHQIQVEGHTDNLPMNSPVFPSNWELSTARASSVIRLFAENGVGGNRMVAIGYADYRPVEDNSTPEGRARNRRVTVMILAENQGGVQDVKLDPDVKPPPSPVPAASAQP